METTTLALRAPAPWRVAYRQQFLLLGRSKRIILLFLVAAAMLGLAEVASRAMAAGAPEMAIPPAAMLFFPGLWILAAAWAITIWRDEGPAKRSYHASMPYPRVAHDLTRLFAGACWLLGAVALMILTGFALAALRGQVGMLLETSAVAWLNYFTAPLQIYLAVSIATVVLNRPVEWILGGFVALVTMTFIAAQLQFHWFIEALVKVIGRPWGFGGALFDGFGAGLGIPVATTRVYADSPDALRVDGVEVVTHTADVGTWLAAAGLWLAGLTLALWLAARKRRLG